MNEGRVTDTQETVKHKGISLRMRITLLMSVLLLVLNGLLVGYSLYSGGQHFSKATDILTMEIEPIDTNNNEKFETSQIQPSQTIEMTELNLPPEQTAIAVLQEARTGFRKEVLLFFLAVDVIGILAVYFVVGKAMVPLTKLSEKMAQIDENNWDYASMDIDARDEIGQVAKSFRHLMSRLEEAFQIQKNFASNAAHELKTPLAVMKSSIQVLYLEEKPSAEEYDETLKLCLDTTEQLSKMVEELLMISNPITEVKQKISLKKMLMNVLQKYELEISSHHLSVKQQICKDAYYTNPTLFQFILENLISNAIKYNKPNGTIFISIEQQNNMLKLEVADTGVGIPRESLPHIFDCFYRVDPSHNNEIEGNGLGLAIVKTAVEKLNGEISVQSEEGVGTCFYVALPL